MRHEGEGLEDMDGYFLLQNSQLVKHIAGAALGKKYTNIQMKLFKKELSLNEKQFITVLKEWLL